MSTRFHGVRLAVRNSAYLAGAQYASMLIRLVYVVILVRWLAPSEYGLLNYSMAWYLALIPLTYLGADVVLSRGIARDKNAAGRLIGITLKMRLHAIVAISVASAVLALVIEADAQARELILILTLALVGRSVWIWGYSVFAALERARSVLWIEITFRSVEVFTAAAYLLLVGADLTAMATIHAMAWCAQGAVTMVLVAKLHKFELRSTISDYWRILADGYPGAVFALAMAAYFQLPIVLYRQVEGTGDSLGYFALAFQLVAYLQIMPYAIAQGSLPVLSRSAARRDGKDRIATLALIGMIPSIGLLFIMSMSWIAEPVVEWLFGRQYSAAAGLFANALWLLIPLSLAMLLQQIVFANAIRSQLAVHAPIAGVVAMAVLFPELTRSLDTAGSFIAIGIGLSLWLLCTAAVLMRAGFFAPRAVQR